VGDTRASATAARFPCGGVGGEGKLGPDEAHGWGMESNEKVAAEYSFFGE
jgi:hypothetical protein